MKNIHVLPTDKPSRLFTSFEKLNIGDYITERENTHVQNQNIYITSDEEIKEGDWFILHLEDRIAKRHKQLDLRGMTPEWSKKIILTTDQDLIKDGVQAIDDEFLEWFIKNQSWEVVKIVKQKVILGRVDGTTYVDFNYKIIIPKEETKQERMYSDEDMLKMLQKFGFDYTYNYKGEKSIYEWIPEWFEEYKRLEQFKNK